MAFTALTSGQIASGEPVTTDLWTKTKDNFDDHQTRIGDLELSLLTNEYDAIVASPAIAGLSTHLTITAAIAAVTAGARILVLRGTFTENVTVNKNLYIEGSGRGTVISGNITFSSASQNSLMEKLKFTGNITFSSGAIGNVVDNVYVLSTMVYTDSNAVDEQNFFQAMEE